LGRGVVVAAKVLWALLWSGLIILVPFLLLGILTAYLMSAKLPEKVEVTLYLGGILLFLVIALAGLVLIWKPFFS
jgi:ABC-type transport system involved in multi-copper enzyme maturation permease subunit